MRFSKFAVMASALTFVACGGGEKKPEATPAKDSTAAPAAAAGDPGPDHRQDRRGSDGW